MHFMLLSAPCIAALVGLAVAADGIPGNVHGTQYAESSEPLPAPAQDDPENVVSMLQVAPLQLQPPPVSTVKASQQSLLDRLLPMAWVHVPKCGSSLFNALIRLPGACRPWVTARGSNVSAATAILREAKGVFDADGLCPGTFSKFGRREAQVCGHSGAGGRLYEPFVRGHGMIMLRQPEQRLLSGFYFHQHSWPEWYYNRKAASAKEYAEVIRGCAVRTLTREGRGQCGSQHGGYSVCGDPVPATDQETQLAIARLRSGFLFVGLTEEWDLSVCLLHAMFGGVCSAAEFMNSRPGNKPGAKDEEGEYDTAPLGGVVDKADGLLYAEAARIFRANLQRYGVNASSCEPCFQQAASEASSS